MLTPNNSTSSPHAERQYLHTMVAGALLPFAQSTITALVIAVGTWVVCKFVFDLMDSYKSFILAFAVTWVISFLLLQRHWFNLTTIERITQVDINRDGVVGPAPVEAPRRKIVIDMATVDKGQYAQTRLNLPGTELQLDTFARGVLNGMPMSEKTWTPVEKLYSIADYRDLKEELRKKKLIEYISEADKRQGVRLTPLGKKYFEEVIADNSPTPS